MHSSNLLAKKTGQKPLGKRKKKVLTENIDMPSEINRLNADAFCRGYCAELALALHRYTGWPIAVFNEVVKEDGEEFENFVHATCKASGGRYADARGFRGEQEIIRNLLGITGIKIERYSVSIVSEEDLENETNIDQDALEDAEFFIMKNLKLWGLNRKGSKTWYSIVKNAQSNEILYHVTQTKNVNKIKAKGILPMQTTNWVRGTGERYGGGEIYSLDNFQDAIRWAAKMDWEFNHNMGTGDISIISFRKENDWDKDENDPVSQAGNNGQWLKRMKMVKASDIIDSVPLTLDLIRTINRG